MKWKQIWTRHVLEIISVACLNLLRPGLATTTFCLKPQQFWNLSDNFFQKKIYLVMIIRTNNKNSLFWNIFMPLSLLGSARSQGSHFRHSVFLANSMKLNLCYVSNLSLIWSLSSVSFDFGMKLSGHLMTIGTPTSKGNPKRNGWQFGRSWGIKIGGMGLPIASDAFKSVMERLNRLKDGWMDSCILVPIMTAIDDQKMS